MTRDTYGIEVRNHRPRGWRTLTGEPVRETAKAVQCAYYAWLLWLPKSRMVRTSEGLHCHVDTIDASKAHQSAERS